MKFIALKELPKGTRPGETFEATEDEGRVLMLVGAAARVADTASEGAEEAPRTRRTYRRRDLEVESNRTLTSE